MIRQWMYDLPDYQLQLLAILIGVIGLLVLQISFSAMRLHDEDALMGATIAAKVAAGASTGSENASPDAPTEAPEGEGQE